MNLFASGFDAILLKDGSQKCNSNGTPMWASTELHGITPAGELGNRKVFPLILSRNTMPKAGIFSCEMSGSIFQEVDSRTVANTVPAGTVEETID